MPARPSPVQPLDQALALIRGLLLDPEGLRRAVAAGRRRGHRPGWVRVEFRYVDLSGGRQLQITRYDATSAVTANHDVVAAAAAVDELLAEPFGNWHVQAASETLQLRVTKRGQASVHRETTAAPAPADRGHDRVKSRLLAADDPLLHALGLADPDGRIKPSRQRKYRQVEEFARLLVAAVDDARSAGVLRTPTEQDPLRVVDLGCGNGYLSFVAHRVLSARGLPATLVGVDVKEQSFAHNSALAESVGIPARFVVGSIADAEVPDDRAEVVLALHACDTATDEALARAVGWGAPVILAAPCCHHDLAAQLRARPAPAPYGLLTRDGIVRERLADTLTDGLRAGLLRARGWRVDVVEFVGSEHTPRNTLLRAVRTGRCSASAARETADLIDLWGLRPRLAALLEDAAPRTPDA